MSGRQIFFYGILRADIADWDFLKGIGPARPATTEGTIWAVPTEHGWYPALLAGDDEVHGLVHDASALDFAPIDEFEGCYPDEPERSEYLRETIAVASGGETIAAQAYIWNRQVTDALVHVAHGDFARWLAETGNRSFSR